MLAFDDIDGLRELFKERRIREGYSLRGIARVIDCSFSVLSRFELGIPLGMHVRRRVYQWLYPGANMPQCHCYYCIRVSHFSAKEWKEIEEFVTVLLDKRLSMQGVCDA